MNPTDTTDTTLAARVNARLAELKISTDDMPPARLELLGRAIDLDDATWRKIAEAYDVETGAETILIPIHHIHRLSRGKGWCRCGTGDRATWGSREGDEWRVGPGTWTAQGNDGYGRKESTTWVVEFITVGDERWILAR